MLRSRSRNNGGSLPDHFVCRQLYPGPDLAIRVLDAIWLAFVVPLSVQTVGD